jgi:hypothetical protein
MWTVNVLGNCVEEAEAAGYHAYGASCQGQYTTAIEIPASSKDEAIRKASKFGKVAIAYE